MEWDTWKKLYNRLCAAKDHGVNGEQCSAYFEVLKDFPNTCVEQAVFRATREVTGWPKSDAMVALAREERGKLDTPKSACTICHGAAWVEGPPRVEPWGTFETAMRCPACWPKRTSKEPAA